MQPIHWQTLEYEPRKKSTDWYWALGIIAVSAAVTAIILGNILFAILILIGAFLVGIFAAKDPEIINCEINDRGVVINKTLYPYKDLDSFWVEIYSEEDGKLILKSKKTLMPHIVIPIEEASPESVHEKLLEHLEEEEMSESISEKILELFGF
jgi:hypothetical protein